MTGKEKCELLRTIRKDIAEKNNIQYNPGTCYHEGDCPGFCPRCDEESAFLMRELKKLEEVGGKIVIDTKLFDKINGMNNLASPIIENQLNEIGNERSEPYEVTKGGCIIMEPFDRIDPSNITPNDDEWA